MKAKRNAIWTQHETRHRGVSKGGINSKKILYDHLCSSSNSTQKLFIGNSTNRLRPNFSEAFKANTIKPKSPINLNNQSRLIAVFLYSFESRVSFHCPEVHFLSAVILPASLEDSRNHRIDLNLQLLHC